MALVDDLLKRREGLVAYLQLKVDDRDWHGVADAAMDIREVEAQIACLDRVSVLTTPREGA